tara:strand:- start:1818 stop:2192 length:375 start_codon:yes stop_codon:yes gene_type:complete
MKTLLALLLLIPSLSWGEIRLDCKVPDSLEITDDWKIKPSRYYEFTITDDIQIVTNEIGDTFIRTNISKDIEWEKTKGVYVFYHEYDPKFRLQISRKNFNTVLQHFEKPWPLTPYYCEEFKYLF